MIHRVFTKTINSNENEARAEFPVAGFEHARVQVEATSKPIGTAAFAVTHRLYPTDGEFVAFGTPVTIAQTGATALLDIRAVSCLAVEVSTPEGADEDVRITVALAYDQGAGQ